MKIIIGLGNPGAEYANTRHNAGVMLVDQMYNEKCTLLRQGYVGQAIYKDGYGWRRKKDIFVAEFPDLILVKSAGYFMNESGRIVGDLRMMYDLTPGPCLAGRQASPHFRRGENDVDVLIAHDDLDLRLGEYKIQMGKGPKVHNGVNSVEGVLGTKEFGRIRIGVDNREPSYAKASEGEQYVLQKFSLEEKKVLDGVLENICEEVL
jgi:peptidyl-tRNA hydrolase, PTH1 family